MCCFLICLRAHGPNMWVEWDSPEELAEADRELLDDDRGCGDELCAGAHLLVSTDEHGTHSAPSVHDPPPASLAVELSLLYPRNFFDDLLDVFPAPDELNPPFEQPVATAALPERMARAPLLRAPLAPPPYVGAAATLAAHLGLPGVAAPRTARSRTCAMAGCERKHQARGLCKPHYDQWRALRGRVPKKTVEERFWSRVDKSGSCWLWTGAKGGVVRYGQFHINGKRIAAHHFSYQLTVGPLPAGCQLAHDPGCPRHCVRPDHLHPVTPRELTRLSRNERELVECH
jgi:hypothetical protein